VVDELPQDGEASDPVGDRVVDHDDEGAATPRHARDVDRAPEGPVAEKGPVPLDRGQLEQGVLVARKRAWEGEQVTGQIEVRIINPAGSSEVETRRDQSLP
jgi:hypothetical protein